MKSKKSTPAMGSKSKMCASNLRADTLYHFARFIETRIGVEAFVEPPTHMTSPTLVLIANTGEWTRRRVPSQEEGWKLARELDIPVYDVNQVGYPNRMREWNSKKRAQWQEGNK